MGKGGSGAGTVFLVIALLVIGLIFFTGNGAKVISSLGLPAIKVHGKVQGKEDNSTHKDALSSEDREQLDSLIDKVGK